MTCSDGNIASIRTIEKAGGVRIDDSTIAGPKRRRYSIPLRPVIDELGPDHFDAIASLWQRAQHHGTDGAWTPSLEGTLETLRTRNALPDAWSAGVLHDNMLVGMVHGLQARENGGLGVPVPGLMHVSMLAVDPTCWGRGIGKAMIEFALACAVDRGFRSVQLFTPDANVRACNLYESFGFVAHGTQRDDRGELVRYYRLTVPSDPARE